MVAAMKATPKRSKKAAPKKKVARKTSPKPAVKKTATKKVRKVGSGRTKGSYSFINVKLTDLNKALPESSVVMISRKWAQNLMSLGIKIKGTPIPATTNNHNSMGKPIDVKMTNTKNEEEDASAQVSLKTDF